MIPPSSYSACKRGLPCLLHLSRIFHLASFLLKPSVSL